MDKEITYDEFRQAVQELWKDEIYIYGSMQFPAAKARDMFIERGVTNASEMFEKLRIAKGDGFYYAGD